MKTATTRTKAAASTKSKKTTSLAKKSSAATAEASATRTEAGISDAAVAKATGKTWDEWFRRLDKSGAKELDHKQIAELLATKFEVPPWWSQMLTVGYEQARGMRVKHERPGGDFSVSSNKTIAAPIATVFAAWSDPKQRKKWLRDPGFTVRKETANRSLRVTWTDGKPHVEVMFYSKGAAKTQVSVEHKKLTGTEDVEKKRAYWKKELAKLAEMLAE